MRPRAPASPPTRACVASLAAVAAVAAVASFGALWALAACGADRGAPAGPAVATLGTGAAGYEPLGATLAAHMGPQGGFHVYLSLRAGNVRPGDPREPPTACSFAGTFANPCIAFTVTDLDAGRQLSSFAPLRLPLLAEGDGFVVQPTRLVPLELRALAEIDGHRLRVTGSIVDASGARAEDVREVTCLADR